MSRRLIMDTVCAIVSGDLRVHHGPDSLAMTPSTLRW